MSHQHLTPDQISVKFDLEEAEVFRICREHSVPVYHGRIDKTLFAASLAADLEANAA